MATFTPRQRICYEWAIGRWALTKAASFSEDEWLWWRPDGVSKGHARRTFRSLVRREEFVPVSGSERFTLGENAVQREIRAADRDHRAYNRFHKANGWAMPI